MKAISIIIVVAISASSLHAYLQSSSWVSHKSFNSSISDEPIKTSTFLRFYDNHLKMTLYSKSGIDTIQLELLNYEEVDNLFKFKIKKKNAYYYGQLNTSRDTLKFSSSSHDHELNSQLFIDENSDFFWFEFHKEL